jgi:aspartate-semialdehyde dehydrogenase
MTTPPGRGPWPVAVLGATGAVGQTFVRMLAAHPWFRLVEVAASERSAGKRYADATQWLGTDAMPAAAADLIVQPCDPATVTAPIVFSALDAAVAGDAEPAFARAGRLVLSNAKNHRMWDDVPLVVPDVNADHQAILAHQRAARGWPGHGAIITNSNCAAAVAAMALKPLHEAFGLERLVITTMQAVSGAGYPGVPSLDILGNVIPYIADEEPKIEAELPKLLGRLVGERIEEARIQVSATANRVPVEHGHTASLVMGFARPPSPEDAIAALRQWRGPDGVRGLPSAPEHPVVVTDVPNRPQARRDVWVGQGMSVMVGRVRRDALLDLRCTVLGHNVVVGAAGASLLNAEWLAAQGYLRAVTR